MYRSRVERQFEAAHHNGPPGHRCETNHGHTWKVVVEFEYGDKDLSPYGWGPDFGRVKQIIDELDHGDLNVIMDGIHPSAENVAKYLWHSLQAEFGMAPYMVQIAEGGGNTIILHDDHD